MILLLALHAALGVGAVGFGSRLGRRALAVGVIMFVVIFILTYLANRFTRTTGTEYEPGE